MQQGLENGKGGERTCLRWTSHPCVTCLVPVSLLNEKYEVYEM